MRTLKLVITVIFMFTLGLSLSSCVDPVEYTVYFDSNGGTAILSVTTSRTSAISIPDNPTKEGYTFVGWYWDNATFESPFTANSLTDTLLSSDMTVYAKWDPIIFNIIYVLNGGINDSSNPATFVVTIEIELANPTKEGYTFGGWYQDAEFSTTYSFTTIPLEDLTLYAKWNINQYTMTFEENGGSDIDDITQDFGTPINEPLVPTKQGFTFDGWYVDIELTDDYTFTTMPAEDITLYAKWNPNQYEMSFETFDGSPMDSVSYSYGQNLVITIPLYEGYNFLGWYLDAELTLPFDLTVMPNYDLTIYAKWIFDDGIAHTELIIMHGAPYEVDPFHPGYTGTDQLAKQLLQSEVEERLNVTIIYRPYPVSAPWGPDRVTAIIQSSLSGDHLADIYWSTSDWIQLLANGNAIVPFDQYLNIYGQNINDSYLEVGSYQGEHYGFGNGKLTVDFGLFYNANLVAGLGVDNPTQLYLDGQWTWSRFDTWATQVQTLLSAQAEDMHALGGMLSYYAESMIPLNGGRLIDVNTSRVAFAQTPALETYTFLNSLYTKGLFELNPQYDAGSSEWMAGKIAIHPGYLWFVNAANRWGGLAFNLGFVPYPRSDAYTGEYASPISSVPIYHVASGMTPEKEALVFQVWNELQLWKTDEQLKDAFEASLKTALNENIYVEAYLDIYDKTYLDLCNMLGISAYGENGWRRNINIAIKDGTSGTVVDQIKPVYESALEAYLNG